MSSTPKCRTTNTTPAEFATNWLGFVQNRGRAKIPEHAPRPLTDQGTAKGYFFKTYAVPSITYEVGDESKPKRRETNGC